MRRIESFFHQKTSLFVQGPHSFHLFSILLFIAALSYNMSNCVLLSIIGPQIRQRIRRLATLHLFVFLPWMLTCGTKMCLLFFLLGSAHMFQYKKPHVEHCSSLLKEKFSYFPPERKFYHSSSTTPSKGTRCHVPVPVMGESDSWANPIPEPSNDV